MAHGARDITETWAEKRAGQDRGGGRDIDTINFSRGNEMQISKGQEREKQLTRCWMMVRDFLRWFGEEKAVLLQVSTVHRGPWCSRINKGFDMRPGSSAGSIAV